MHVPERLDKPGRMAASAQVQVLVDNKASAFPLFLLQNSLKRFQ
jgi:hypothetical protein